MADSSKSFSVGFLYVPKMPGLDRGVPVLIPNVGDYFSPIAQVLLQAGIIKPEVAKWLKSSPDTGVQTLIQKYGLFYAVKIGNEVSVYSNRRRQKLPPAVAQGLLHHLGVTDTTPAGWYAKTDGNPAFTTVGETAFGEQRERSSPTGAPGYPAKPVLKWSGQHDIETADEILSKYLG